MSVSILDPEQWNAAYDVASAQQQYDMLLEAIAQPLSPQLIDEVDLGMLLVEMRDELVSHNLLDQATDFIHTLQQQQPDLYQQEFPYLDNLLVEYYLYRNELSAVQSALAHFMANPAEDIDQTLVVLDYLKFYDAADLALDLCRTIFQPVRSSSNVIAGVEIEFSLVILSALMQQADQQLQHGEPIDWQALHGEAVRYGFEDKPRWIEEVQYILTTPLASPEELFLEFKRNRARALRYWSLTFCRYMATAKHLSFVGSDSIWQTVFDFLEGSRELPRKQSAHPETYFTIVPDQLDRYAGQKVGGFLSMERAKGFALLWGLPYVYDWLHSQQIISDKVHQRTIDTVNTLKAQLTNAFPALWKYDFVHRWQPADSTTDCADEAAQFTASLEQITPLSDKPGEGASSSLLHLMDDLPELLIDDDLDDESDDDLAGPIGYSQPIAAPPPLKPFQPPKPRKSALKLAADLEPKKVPKKTKKKKR